MSIIVRHLSMKPYFSVNTSGMNRLLNNLECADMGRLILLALLSMIFISDFSLYALFKTGNELYFLPLFLSAAGAVYAAVHIPEAETPRDYSTHYHLLIVSEESLTIDQPKDYLDRRW